MWISRNKITKLVPRDHVRTANVNSVVIDTNVLELALSTNGTTWDADGTPVTYEPKSAAELADELEQRKAQVRTTRDTLLLESDVRVVRFYESGLPVTLDWKTYRQSLRDIPSQPGFPDAVVWPVKPTT